MLSAFSIGKPVGVGKATVAVLVGTGVLVIGAGDWVRVLVAIGVGDGLSVAVHAIIEARIRMLTTQVRSIFFIVCFPTN
jgi:hypothetical protein